MDSHRRAPNRHCIFLFSLFVCVFLFHITLLILHYFITGLINENSASIHHSSGTCNAIRLKARLPHYNSEAILWHFKYHVESGMFTFVLFRTAFGSRVRFCRDLMLVLIQQMSSQRLKPQRLRHCTV